jgi:hypothetical protein
MIASSMNAEVLMLQRVLEVRQGGALGYQLLASFRLEVGLRGLLDPGWCRPPGLLAYPSARPWLIQQQN